MLKKYHSLAFHPMKLEGSSSNATILAYQMEVMLDKMAHYSIVIDPCLCLHLPCKQGLQCLYMFALVDNYPKIKFVMDEWLKDPKKLKGKCLLEEYKQACTAHSFSTVGGCCSRSTPTGGDWPEGEAKEVALDNLDICLLMIERWWIRYCDY